MLQQLGDQRVQWEQRYDFLDEKMRRFKNEFSKNRSCNCKTQICFHYKKEEMSRFGNEMKRLIVEGVLINAATDSERLRRQRSF